MSRNFQNNYRGGWNNIPATNFSHGVIRHGGPLAFADNRHILHQAPTYYANNRHIPHQTPTYYADNRHLPPPTVTHYADNMSLLQQRTKDLSNKRALPHQKPKAYGKKKCLPSMIHCEICYIKLSPKDLKGHNNGRKHQRRLSMLREKSMKHNTSNGSQVNPVVQPKKVPADVSKGKHGDHTGAKDCDFKVENVKNETSSFKEKKVPVEMSERKVMDNTDAKDHGFKHEIEGATGGKYMKMNDGTRRFVKSSKIEVNAVSNSVKSLVQTPEITPPSGHVASSELAPVLTEIDGALEIRVETKTEDGSSQAEMKMDVDLSPESGKTKLLKVSVCLMCGDEGFEKAIVYCSKCGYYAMHRYCLAGPMIFTDKVTWFCEDCEEMVVQADHPNSETPESEKEVVLDPEPIADPIWSGSLQVFNKSFDKISGLMGHLSTLACPKVREEARHLPDVLYANLLQRSAVWPESFKKFGTNNLSIGLYFFPHNERVERYYDQIVDEMISNDLAIRVMVEKTELLIFPSTLLPRQYKRFHSKYYLWGIFRSKPKAP